MKLVKYLLSLILFFFFLFVFLYFQENKYQYCFDNSLFDQKPATLRQSFLTKLNKEKIEYKISHEHDICCLREDADQADKILNNVLSNRTSKPGIYIKNDDLKILVINLLKKNNIPFEIQTNYLLGKNYIRWDTQYTNRVANIVIKASDSYQNSNSSKKSTNRKTIEIEIDNLSLQFLHTQ
ncbi:MAG: hypothetical protein SWH61_09180 [Thermodesulfobacteriota bacterium]|nr:hypothetical protein [Thermodesulfobacteriota bacterium]